ACFSHPNLCICWLFKNACRPFTVHGILCIWISQRFYLTCKDFMNKRFVHNSTNFHLYDIVLTHLLYSLLDFIKNEKLAEYKLSIGGINCDKTESNFRWWMFLVYGKTVRSMGWCD